MLYSGQFINANYGVVKVRNVRFVQMKGPCNQSDPIYQFDGMVCKDEQKYLQFNSNYLQNANDALQGFIAPSTGKYTFEAWFKVQNPNTQNPQTLMAQYQYNTQLLVSVVIQSSQNNLSISCVPYSTSQNTNPQVQISKLLQTEIWSHYACISDNDLDEIRGVLYNIQLDQSTVEIVTESHIMAMPEIAPVRTLLGNDISYGSPFGGFIREVRFWQESRSLQEIEQYRFQSLPVNQVRTNLLSYLQLNQGYGTKLIQQDYTPSIESIDFYTQQPISPIQWISDIQAPKICAPGQIFTTGKVCTLERFQAYVTQTNKKDNLGEITSILSVVINETYDRFYPANNSFTYQWSLDHIGEFTGDSETADQHRKSVNLMVNSQSTTSEYLIIYQAQLFSDATYTFKLLLTSIYANYNATQILTYLLLPSCPTIEIQPKVQFGTQLMISAYMDPAQLELVADTNIACENQQVDVISIEWNQKQIINKKTYYQLPDQKTIVFNTLDFGFTSLNLTARMWYTLIDSQGQSSQMQHIDDYIMITVNKQPIIMMLDSNEGMLLEGSNIQINPGRSQFNVNYPTDINLNFSVQCPPYLFKSKLQYSQLCKANPDTGYVNLASSELNVVDHANYTFNYTISSNVIQYNTSQAVSFMFYNYWYYNCPGVYLDKFTHHNKNEDFYLIKPQLKLYCRDELTSDQNITKHQLSSLEWYVVGYDNASDFLDFSLDRIYAWVKDGIKNNLQPGYQVNVTIVGGIEGVYYKSTTTLVIEKAGIDIVITDNLKNGYLDFNQTLILDATQSQDPDFPPYTQQLIYSWLCPVLLNSDICNNKDGILRLTPLQRLKSGLQMNNAYDFGIMVGNSKYMEKQTKANSIVTFGQHDPNHQSQNCGQIDIKTNIDDDKLIFNRINVSDITNIMISQVGKPSQCKTNVNQSELYIFVPVILSVNNISYYSNQQSLNFSKTQMMNLPLNISQYVDIVYVYEYLDSNNQTMSDYLVKRIEFLRIGTPLVAMISNTRNQQDIIEVQADSELIIDGSQSYDPDSDSKAFIYKWTCPPPLDTYCSQISESQLVLSWSVRESSGFNSVGTQIIVGLTIETANKKSNITNVMVQILRQSYENCIDVGLQSIGLSQVTVMRDAYFPMRIQLVTGIRCPYTVIESQQWGLTDKSNQVDKFWEIDVEGDFMTIYNSSQIPIGLDRLNFTIEIQYVVQASPSELLQKTELFNFTIIFQASQLKPQLSTNLEQIDSVYCIGSNQSLIIDATGTFDLDFNSDNQPDLTCQWQCPDQIYPKSLCSISDCKIEFPQQALESANFNKQYDILEFKVMIISSVNKSAYLIHHVTLLSMELCKQVPLCEIKNVKPGFDLNDQIVLYPACMISQFQQQINVNYIQAKDLQYQWETEPTSSIIQQNSKKLIIPAFTLIQYIIDTHAVDIIIKLTIKVPSSNSEYALKMAYQLPQLKELPNGLQVAVQPNFGYTILDTFTFSLTNYALKDGQYYRVRIVKVDYSQDILISQSTNTTFHLNLPKGTKLVYFDIIENKALWGNNYTIYSIQAQFQVTDQASFNMHRFQTFVDPLLNTPIQCNFKDIDQVEQEVENMLGLALAIEGFKNLDPSTYSTQLQTKLQSFMDSVRPYLNYYTNDFKLRIFSKVLQVAVVSYKILYNDPSQQQDALTIVTILISSELVTSQLFPKPNQQTIGLNYQQIFLQQINKIINTNNLDTDSQKMFERIYQNYLLRSMIPGEQNSFLRDNTQTVLYKFQALDFQQPQVLPSQILPLSFSKSPNESDNIIGDQSYDQSQLYLDITANDDVTKVKLIPYRLSNQTQYVVIKYIQNDSPLIQYMYPNNTNSSSFQLISSKKASISLLDIQENLFELPKTQYSANYAQLVFQLQINPQLDQLQIMNSSNRPQISCESQRSDLDNTGQLNWSNTGILTQILNNGSNGVITCDSSHLSMFGVLYNTSLYQVAIDKDDLSDNNEIDSLKYQIAKIVIPGIFLLFTVLMIIIGGFMAQYDINSPRRLYNKLTLAENLNKYSLLRLTGCIILQFNPFFNYVFKTNFYLNRFTRLLMLSNQIMLISAISLIYFRLMENEQLISSVIGIAMAIWGSFVLFRPLILAIICFFFYPKDIRKWKYELDQEEMDEDRVQNEEYQIQKKTSKNKQFDIDEDLYRDQQSFNRLVENIKSPEEAQEEGEIIGNEILEFRQQSKKKKLIKKKPIASQDLSYSEAKSKSNGQIKGSLPSPNKSAKKNGQQIEIEMISLPQNKVTRVDEVINENESDREFNMLGGDLVPESSIEQSRNHRNILQLDETENNDSIQKEGGDAEDQGPNYDNEEEMKEDSDPDEKYNIYDDYDDENIKQNNKTIKKSKRSKMKSKVKDADMLANGHSKSIKGRKKRKLDPELETIQLQYRTLEKQQTSLVKQIIGSCILIAFYWALIVTHVMIFLDIEPNQFDNWLTCTIFAFVLQIFVIDTILYLIVAWALKRTAGYGTDSDRKWCSLFNWLVMRPLGRYKYAELETEIAKLKDFDKEYDLLVYR